MCLLSIIGGNVALRHFALWRAYWRLRPYRQEYDKRWMPIAESSCVDLQDLVKRVRHIQQEEIKQPTDNLDTLYLRACGIHAWWTEYMGLMEAYLNRSLPSLPTGLARF